MRLEPGREARDGTLCCVKGSVGTAKSGVYVRSKATPRLMHSHRRRPQSKTNKVPLVVMCCGEMGQKKEKEEAVWSPAGCSTLRRHPCQIKAGPHHRRGQACLTVLKLPPALPPEGGLSFTFSGVVFLL